MLLRDMKFKCDLVVLGETKLKQQQSNLYNINGYNKYSCCRHSEHCGGGLLVYAKKDLKINQNEIVKSTTSFEKLKLPISLNGTTVNVICYYRPPVSNTTQSFMDDLEHELASNSKMVIVGDVNYNSTPDNVESANYINLLSSYNVNILNLHATRNVSGRVIDHFASNLDADSMVRNFTVTNGISDHNLIVTQLCKWKPQHSTRFAT